MVTQPEGDVLPDCAADRGWDPVNEVAQSVNGGNDYLSAQWHSARRKSTHHARQPDNSWPPLLNQAPKANTAKKTFGAVSCKPRLVAASCSAHNDNEADTVTAPCLVSASITMPQVCPSSSAPVRTTGSTAAPQRREPRWLRWPSKNWPSSEEEAWTLEDCGPWTRESFPCRRRFLSPR